MDILMVVLRLIHIIAGIMWVGFAIFAYFIIEPVIASTAREGQPFVRSVLQSKRLTALFPIVSIATTLAGVVLYWRVSGGFNADWFGDFGNIVLTVGAVAGLGATGHGGAVLSKANDQRAEALRVVVASGNQPTAEQTQKLADADAYYKRHALISLVLMIVAVVCMASARYL